jgi:thiamine biosynthesis lipoprotein
MNGEASTRFACFGGSAEVFAGSFAGEEPPAAAVAAAQQRLLEVHGRLSRFLPDSELSRLNRDPRTVIPSSETMLRFVEAAIMAARLSGGLVDATRLDAVEGAGYTESRSDAEPLPLAQALALASDRRPARAGSDRAWERLRVDRKRRLVVRPRGLRVDSGGIAKGMAADLLADSLSRFATFAVNCCGDLRIGGAARAARTVRVDDPFGGGPIHELEVVAGGVATSGIGRRSWRRGDGTPAHHLIDPSTGLPAYTGVVQATALGSTALEAEVRAKCAVLGGPARSHHWLSGGGVAVLEDGSAEIIDPPRMRSAMAA